MLRQIGKSTGFIKNRPPFFVHGRIKPVLASNNDGLHSSVKTRYVKKLVSHLSITSRLFTSVKQAFLKRQNEKIIEIHFVSLWALLLIIIHFVFNHAKNKPSTRQKAI